MKSIYAKAKALADHLFTDGFNERAEQLVLMKGGKVLGSWGYAAVIAAIHQFFGQPLPKPTNGPSTHDLAIELLKERKEIGLERYGVLLQPHNGRDALQDAIEEAADLLVYLIQKREEEK